MSTYQNLKIIFALVASFIITSSLSNFFLGGSPRINKLFLSKIFSQKSSFTRRSFNKGRPTPTLLPTDSTDLTDSNRLQPTKPILAISGRPHQDSQSPILTKKPSPTPTSPPTTTPKPTQPPPSSCLTISNQSYQSLKTISDYTFSEPAASHPEINLGLRGYVEVNEKAGLVHYGGDTDWQALKINSLFTDGRMPTIIKTYRVYAWDYAVGKRSNETETAWPVSLIGLAAAAGEPLVVPPSGREIGEGFELMVLYAESNRLTFTNSRGDNWTDGYIFHVEDICVDPNLIATYEKDNGAGRGSLPVLRRGQVFGSAKGSEVKVAIRDSGQFMDPRSDKDWW